MARLQLPQAEDTSALGARLAGILSPGDALFLFGELGAGKTTLARGAVAAWCGGMVETPSPTYTLAQTYDGPRGVLWHFDLYRLRAPEERFELGLEEALSTGVIVVEWPERLGGWAPRNRIEARLTMVGNGRAADINGFGRLARLEL